MRSLGVDRRTPIGANMTPMIDVVFLLIIFFLVSSHLAKQETRPPLDLPIAGAQQPDDPSATGMTVNIDADQTIWVAGAAIDTPRLVALLQAHVDKHGGAAALRIRTDRSVPYAVVQPLLREAARAGIAQIAFAVRQR